MSEEKTEMPVEEEATVEEPMGQPTEEPAEAAAEAQAEEEKTRPNMGDELQQLGRNLTAATKAVLESPEAQEVNAQLHKGLESLEKTVGQLTRQVRESSVGKTVESGVSEAATTVKSRGLLETLAESFATALHTVNQTLEQSVEKAQARAEEEKQKRSGPQAIEVVAEEEEPPDEPETSEE